MKKYCLVLCLLFCLKGYSQSTKINFFTDLQSIYKSIDSVSGHRDKKKDLPVIGISSDPADSKIQVNQTYITSVIEAGGIPYILPVTNDVKVIEDCLDKIDGILFTGGKDIHPLLFNEQPSPHLGVVSSERDLNDLAWIYSAMKRNMPILGICRGEQLINVANGGSLYQDIPSEIGSKAIMHRQSFSGKIQSHVVTIKKESHLSSILNLPDDTLYVNSFHHQSVKKVGQNLKISAIAPDGVVEAIESNDGTIIGVQFHPEYFASQKQKPYLLIFEDLIKKAYLFRKNGSNDRISR